MIAQENAKAFGLASRLRRFARYIVLTGCGLLAVAGSLSLALQSDSRASAPSPTESAIGVVLASGGLYHAQADALDHRQLVSARISNLKDTPDVLIIADRKWQLVQQDLRWGRQVFGAYIDDLAPDDIHQIIGQLEAREHKPKKIVLGISPQFLMQASNDTAENVAGAGAGALDGTGFGLLSIFDNFDVDDTPRPGVAPLDARLDTLFPDGSNVWSMDRSKALAHQDMKTMASKLAQALTSQVERSSFAQIVDTGQMIAEAKSSGIEVVIALTPLHPEIYRLIHQTPTTFKLHEGLEDLFSMARGLEVTTLGSFEPYAAGCKARDFASLAVPGAACIRRSLDAAILADVR